MNAHKRPLLRALRLNAMFSACSAVLMFAGAGWIVMQLGLENSLPVHATAAVLVMFSLQLANIVRTAIIRPLEIRVIIAADIAWVVSSIVLAAIFVDQLTTAGLVLIDAVALAILFFAIRQYQGLALFRHGACTGQR